MTRLHTIRIGVLIATAAMLLGACGGEPEAPKAQPKYKVDTRGLEGPEALGVGTRRTTTTTSSTTTSSTVATSTTFALPGGATCEDLGALLEQPLLDGRDDASTVPAEVRAAAYLRIAGSAPDELAQGWREIMRVQRNEPGADRAAAAIALNQSLPWAARTCPQPRPVWSCTSRVRTDPPPPPPPPPTTTTTTTTTPPMVRPGEPAPPTTVPPPTTTTTTIPPGVPQPDGVLDVVERGEKPLVLDQRDDAVLYGFLKAQRLGTEQLIERTIESRKGPGGWNRGVALTCPVSSAPAEPITG